VGLTSSRVRALNAVFEEGGYTAAARKLGISQPAVTQHIRELQAEFGVALFDRVGGQVVPTRVCRDLYKITSEIRRREDDAVLLLSQERDVDEGTLKLGLGNAMPGMAFVSAFRKRHPGIAVEVEMGSWDKIVQAVEERRLDVGILPEGPCDTRFRRLVCTRQDVVAIAHPDHPLAGADRLPIAALAGEPLVFRGPGSCTQRAVDAAFAAAGFSPRPSMVLDSRDGVLEAVANGIGIGFIWRFASSRHDGLSRVTIEELAAGVEEHVFHLANPVPDAAPHFVAIVRANACAQWIQPTAEAMVEPAATGA